MDKIQRGFRRTVVIIILNDKNEFLSVFCTRNNAIDGVKKDKDIWKLPQGGIHDGESIEGACLRELKEELGVCFKVCEIDKVKEWHKGFSYYFLDDNGFKCFEVRLYPVLIKVKRELLIDLDAEENSSYEWVLKEDFLKNDLGIRKTAYENILKDFGIG